MIQVGNLVSVRWIDISCEDDITEYEALRLEPSEAVSYGLLLVNSDEKITIIGTQFTDGMRREVICFPRCVVKSIEEVK